MLFVVYNKKKQCRRTTAIIVALLYRTIDINPHHEVGFDICLYSDTLLFDKHTTPSCHFFLDRTSCVRVLTATCCSIRIFLYHPQCGSRICRLWVFIFPRCHNHKLRITTIIPEHKLQIHYKSFAGMVHAFLHDVLRNFHDEARW